MVSSTQGSQKALHEDHVQTKLNVHKWHLGVVVNEMKWASWLFVNTYGSVLRNMKEMGFTFLNTVGQWTKIIVRRQEDELPRFSFKDLLPPTLGAQSSDCPLPQLSTPSGFLEWPAASE